MLHAAALRPILCIGLDPPRLDQPTVLCADCSQILRTPAQVALGLYIIRGDNIAIVGEVDEQVDGATDWSQKKAEPLKHIVH